MKIRVEISSLATASISGVGHYTKRLTEALDTSKDSKITASYFNFLNRQPLPDIKLKTAPLKNTLIPLRVYAKLQSYGISFPFDFFLPRADLTIFPNFDTWPTVKSRLRATVIHDLTYLYFPELVEEKNLAHLRRVVPRSIKRSDFIITVSQSVKQELIKEFGIDPHRCIVTSIPPEPAYSKPNNNEIHTKYQIPTKKFIFFIGNREPRKNLATLVEAYCQLPDTIKSEYSLILAGGKGWKSEKSQQAIDDAKNAGEHVVHVGYIDQADSPAFFQKASLFVMPSLYEGFGMPVLEAMSANTPVVASDIPVLRETGGDAALYAAPDSPSDFRDKMLSILSDASLTKELNRKASLQLKKITWKDNAERVINYSKTLL
jgi:glycosyltransferase involved in cell wall biosynthesis